MKPFIEKSNRILGSPLGYGPRGIILAAALLLVPAFVSPLWTMTMYAPQYPNGLRLQIYSHKLEGGNGGQDVKEINILNHYIGMRDLTTEDFTEFKWLPFVVGALGLLFLRGVVFGTVGNLLDITILFAYFSLFSLWFFAYKLWAYGHNLAPTAAVKVAPFMPPLFRCQAAGELRGLFVSGGSLLRAGRHGGCAHWGTASVLANCSPRARFGLPRDCGG